MEDLSPGPAPPTLTHGADDIFWVAHLHAALEAHGFHSGDEEMEAWVFEDQTMSALLTYQVQQQPVWQASQAAEGQQLCNNLLPAP